MRVDTRCSGVSVPWNVHTSMSASVSSLLTLGVDDLRASLSELINVCPVERCNPADCPLFRLRKMNYGQRVQWFASLDRADLEYLAIYHYVCMNIKLGGRGEVSVPADNPRWRSVQYKVKD